MEIRNELPPEWIMTGCMNQFRINVDSTFWTYGDVIFNPGGKKIPDSILAHEALHSVQQREYEGGKDAWWKEYLVDSQFRFEQELQAHGVEYAAVCRETKDRNQRARALDVIATRLTGPLYQTSVKKNEALDGIRMIATAIR